MEDSICFFVEWLDKWQTLIGSLIGGLVGLLAALLVARDARGREERAAAMLLVSNLVKITGIGQLLRDRSEDRELDATQREEYVVENLLNSFPKLSSMFEPSWHRISTVDVYLSSHLSLIFMFYSDVIEHVDVLLEEEASVKRGNNKALSEQDIEAHVKLIYSGFMKEFEHASCAITLIDSLILGNKAFLNRFRRRMKLYSYDSKCQKLLNNG